MARKEQAQRERQAEMERLQANDREFIAYFESLPKDEQAWILDKVIKQAPYKVAFDRQTAHKNMMYRLFFKKVMGV